jgi:outer membrane protein TolC
MGILQILSFNPSLGSNRFFRISSRPAMQNLKLRAALLKQEQKTERMKNTPSIGLEGFLGASQYAETFNPFLSGSWYGSSYVVLSLQFQILSGFSKRNRGKQLILETKGVKSRLEDEINLVNNASLRIAEEIRQIGYQVGLLKDNISLFEENISLNQDRFENGQINTYDLLADQIDLQKEMSKFSEKSAELIRKQIDLIYNSGALSIFLAILMGNLKNEMHIQIPDFCSNNFICQLHPGVGTISS